MSQAETTRVTPRESVRCSSCGNPINPETDTAIVFLGGERDADARVYCPDEYCLRNAEQ